MFNYKKAFYAASDEIFHKYFQKAKDIDDNFYSKNDVHRSDGFLDNAELSSFMKQNPDAPIGFGNRASLFLYELGKKL